MNKPEKIGGGVDSRMVLLYYLLVAIGFIAIFSVEFRSGDSVLQTLLELKKSYAKQALFICISSVVALFILLIDSKFFTTVANLLYLFGILLMLLTFVIGKDISGSKSWIALGGGFNLQPAELCKVFTALALAKYLSRQDVEFTTFRSHLIAIGITLVPALLSIAQKETGLALVYFSFGDCIVCYSYCIGNDSILNYDCRYSVYCSLRVVEANQTQFYFTHSPCVCRIGHYRVQIFC
jgi:rod shape determining protein RodA